MSSQHVDTIAAMATPAGKAALSTLRISGPETYKILDKIFKAGGKKAFPLPYSAYYGDIIDPNNGATLDKVILTTFLSPASYTGEDSAEITTHGNPVIVSKVLQAIFKCGGRMAEAGEFTRRAFLNGKMDLLDVEATSQILNATSMSQAKVALNQLEGLPSKQVTKFRDAILEHLVQLEASLNFPEDAIEAIDEHILGRELAKIYSELLIFADNVKNGSLVASGLKIALFGRPNSGKSSLMNYLLGRDRAIVTDIAGTTRDTLEETFNLGSIPVKLIDTAGLRESSDKIEKIGIDRTKQAIEEAFMVIGVFDLSEELNDEDLWVIKRLKEINKPCFCVANKLDLKQKFDLDQLEELPYEKISALTGENFPVLVDKLKEFLKQTGISGFEEMVLLGAQQAQALEKALEAVKRAKDGVGLIYQDMLAIELEEAVRELGRVNGETVDLNTLDIIFERFCIGK